jgi:hypothetical protein
MTVTLAAALRESQEEIALAPGQVQALGIDPFVTITGYRVTPVVAVVDPDFVPVPQPSEVAEVFEVPLDYLMAPDSLRQVEITHRGRVRHVLSMAGRGSASGARPPPFSTTCVVAWSKCNEADRSAVDHPGRCHHPCRRAGRRRARRRRACHRQHRVRVVDARFAGRSAGGGGQYLAGAHTDCGACRSQP